MRNIVIIPLSSIVERITVWSLKRGVKNSIHVDEVLMDIFLHKQLLEAMLKILGLSYMGSKH